MGSAAEAFHRALGALLASDIEAYSETFAPEAVIEWPFAPSDWPHHRAEGREQVRAIVGANLERARAMGRELVAIHDVVMHETGDGRGAAVEFSLEIRGADGTARLPYIHVLRTTDDGHIASLRDYFSAETAQVARRVFSALSTEDRVAIHEGGGALHVAK